MLERSGTTNLWFCPLYFNFAIKTHGLPLLLIVILCLSRAFYIPDKTVPPLLLIAPMYLLKLLSLLFSEIVKATKKVALNSSSE